MGDRDDVAALLGRLVVAMERIANRLDPASDPERPHRLPRSSPPPPTEAQRERARRAKAAWRPTG